MGYGLPTDLNVFRGCCRNNEPRKEAGKRKPLDQETRRFAPYVISSWTTTNSLKTVSRKQEAKQVL